MESSGGGGRRRQSVVESPNLGDFLRIKQDEGCKSLSGLTLSAVLASEKRPSMPVQVNRTLLDIIRDDPNCSKESKKTWKAFKDKIRLRRPAAAWTSTLHTPPSDVPLHNTNTNSMIYRPNSIRLNSSNNPTSSQLSSSSSNRLAQLNSIMNGEFNSIENGSVETVVPDQRGEEEEEEEEEGEGETEELPAEGIEEGGEVPVRMSLMALLAATDRQMGVDGSNFVMEDDYEKEEEEEDECIGSTVVEYNNCCVCMVRDKGSAFIPCGHTFCRLCSRELWVQRGNCPLCNGFILEILDIF
ncbi:hypothetical protein CsSME_00015853 [Camellia sinensis var. sinensis]